MTPLPDRFLARPLAHRALHDTAQGRPENSRAAVLAAIDAGYGIEIDVQLSADDAAMVFHDYHLARLAAGTGPVRKLRADALAATRLLGSGGEGIPTLPEVLELVAGKVPLVIEIKDQDGAMGPNVGPLEAAVAKACAGYSGDLAVMSFNPHSVAAMRDLAPKLPRGLVTCAYTAQDWPILPAATRAHLALIPDFEESGASFISHDRRDLDAAPVAALKERGVPICCWTVRSPAQEAQARKIADTITFEGYSA